MDIKPSDRFLANEITFFVIQKNKPTTRYLFIWEYLYRIKEVSNYVIYAKPAIGY